MYYCLTQENSLWARTTSSFEARTVSVAHNTADRAAPWRQAGGTALVAMNEVSFRMCDHGKDPRQLGRWTWMRFDGKNGVATRVVSVYKADLANRPPQRGGRLTCNSYAVLQQRELTRVPENNLGST